MRSTKIIKICSSSLCTCLHHMVILRTRNKITDFLMILAWASPFNLSIAKRVPKKTHYVYIEPTRRNRACKSINTYITILTNTRHWLNAQPMLLHRLRRWDMIGAAVGEYIEFVDRRLAKCRSALLKAWDYMAIIKKTKKYRHCAEMRQRVEKNTQILRNWAIARFH